MTDEVREELGHTSDMKDGVFYMTIEQAYEQLKYVSMNYDTEEWYHDYFLALDDDEVGGVEGQYEWCDRCIRYTGWVKNTSGKKNTIRVSAHTWYDVTYGDFGESDKCKTAYRSDT